ncbi:hypothetical protein V1525DRAFT_213415 [Lipomyces kononenkoae]|uniref:Uncharacterized protein n=1 Tax=Lipomyces kononenkoae TaxID=34357 RepID=A0ACC3SXZ2_LIPKO
MSTGEAFGSQSLGCNSAHQEQMSSVKKVEGNHAKSQSPDIRDKSISGRVTLRSDSNPTLSKNKLLNLILSELSNATDERVLEYQAVDIGTAHRVAEELDRLVENAPFRLSYDSLLQNLRVVIMPTELHDSHVPWFENSLAQMLVSGFLTIEEIVILERYPGTTFKSFGPPYQASRKEPDYCVKPIGSRLPTLVLESGWSESRPQLYHDRDLWLRGGQGFVQVILIVKWTKIADKRVKGDIEVFDLDVAGNVRLLQHEIIFPAPDLALALSQHITITRHQLFGLNQPAGQNRAQFTHLSLNDLRVIAARNMGSDGYTPA